MRRSRAVRAALTAPASLAYGLLSRRPVEPTAAGERLLEHAVPLLLRLRAARAAQPRLSVLVRTCGRERLAELLAEGEADLGLADGLAAPSDPLRLPESGPMTTVGVSEEDLVVALPPGHPLAGRRALRLADLVDARWLQTPLCPLPRLRDLAGDGFTAALVHEGDDVHTVLNLVAAGHGLTLLPASAGPGVPLVAPRLVHRVELLHGALPPGPATALAQALAGPPA
ncbi:LysR substrate-binding domain-containing protein [Nonomuraea sp. NPDC052265]|uniref:LysR substrate-binding domain-containing protein n=1 Tax=Nonomuraea sp. NPDC052265 TaxID=3364374 RepID=UPI0037CBA88E